MATIVMSKGRHYHMPVQRRQENERSWPMSQETGGDNERRRPLVQDTGGRWLLTQENGGSWPLGQKIGGRWQSEDMAGGRWQHEQETEGSWLAGQEAAGMWQSGQDCRGRWHTGQENIGNQSSGQDIVGKWPTGQDSGTTWPSGDTSRMEEDSSPSSSSIGSADLYFSREEIDKCSPSRRDGIDAQKETYLRHSYCSFLQNLGMRLQLPQTTIATAMVLCHRFFLRRSHATYDRFIIATSCLFLAAKSEETPRPLNSVVLVSYEMCHKHDLANFHYRMPKDWFEQYKERVLEAEQLVLTTLDFELTVQHPYQPLVTVFEKIGLTETALVHVAWSLINDGLRSSLSLQFKSHHIAAGAAFLAARVLNVDLPSNGTLSWWQEFQTTPAILDSVVQQMLELYGRNGG